MILTFWHGFLTWSKCRLTTLALEMRQEIFGNTELITQPIGMMIGFLQTIGLIYCGETMKLFYAFSAR